MDGQICSCQPTTQPARLLQVSPLIQTFCMNNNNNNTRSLIPFSCTIKNHLHIHNRPSDHNSQFMTAFFCPFISLPNNGSGETELFAHANHSPQQRNSPPFGPICKYQVSKITRLKVHPSIPSSEMRYDCALKMRHTFNLGVMHLTQFY